MTVATKVIQVTFEDASPAPTLTLGAYDDLCGAPQVVVNLMKGDQRIGTVLSPNEAKHVGDWLLGFANEHLAKCIRCKEPVLRSEMRLIGQDPAHERCIWPEKKP